MHMTHGTRHTAHDTTRERQQYNKAQFMTHNTQLALLCLVL